MPISLQPNRIWYKRGPKSRSTPAAYARLNTYKSSDGHARAWQGWDCEQSQWAVVFFTMGKGQGRMR
eukprot:scaffold285038_cov33-Tisochrysis_lutea.AAC.1